MGRVDSGCLPTGWAIWADGFTTHCGYNRT
jgi:hypothetical protein